MVRQVVLPSLAALNPKINTKLFLALFVAFVIATVIGTLSHEAGHCIVAKCLGYHPRLHYGYMIAGDNELNDSINAIEQKYEKQLEEGSSFPAREKYDRLIQKSLKEGLWITIGGPAQTMLTGTIGFILLLIWRRSFRKMQRLNFRQWIIIFIALFWLRQAANLATWLGGYLVTNHFSSRGDEIRIALGLGLPFWSLAAITGATSLLVLCIVVFKFIPRPQRLTFLLSGMVGGVTGYVLWLHLLGPILMP
jgi:hypothetical protein